MIVGNIGSEKRTKYGVVGSHVNLCGRIESYTTGGQILISPQTREMVGCTLEVAQELEVFPKGVKGGLVLSHVTAIGAPYNLSCGTEAEDEQMLAIHMPVGFRRISDKHCSETVYEGELTAINGKQAILKTQMPIRLFENISLCAENEVFCKVLRADDQGILLGFTAGHQDFCARMMGAVAEK